MEIKVSFNGGPIQTEVAMVFIGLDNLRPHGQLLVPFEKIFFQDLNKAIAEKRLFAPRQSAAERLGSDPLERQWNGELQAYQNLCTRNRKYESDGENDLYQQAVKAFVDYAKSKRLPYDQTPQEFLQNIKSWIEANGAQYGKAAIALNHFAQTRFDHRYRIEVTRGTIDRAFSKEQNAEMEELMKVYKAECTRAKILPGNSLKNEIRLLYEAMLDTLEDELPYSTIRQLKKNKKVAVKNILDRVSPAATPSQHTVFTRISDILTNGSIDKSNPISMANLSSLNREEGAAAARKPSTRKAQNDAHEKRRSRRFKP